MRAGDNLTTIAPDAFPPGIHATVFMSRWHKIICGGRSCASGQRF